MAKVSERHKENKHTPYVGICVTCNNLWIFDSKSRYFQAKWLCPQCKPERHECIFGNIINGLITHRPSVRRHANISRFKVAIRKQAARKRPYKRFPNCEKCGKPRHSIHHIKPVSSFSVDTAIKVINADHNLIVLCEKCHKKEHE